MSKPKLKRASAAAFAYPPERITRIARSVLRWLDSTSWMRPYHVSGAIDSTVRIEGRTAWLRAEVRADGAQAKATILVRYGRAPVDRVVSALHRAGYARAGWDSFERRLDGLAMVTREARRFEQLHQGVSFESWPSRNAKRVEPRRHGRPYSPVVTALASRMAHAPWTPLTVGASVQGRHGPISVAWTIVLDDVHADWFEIGLQLRDLDLASAQKVLEDLTRRGFQDGLANVVGKLEGVWAMPERNFHDLATWRAALRRVRKLMA
jgi:hypothetical protein